MSAASMGLYFRFEHTIKVRNLFDHSSAVFPRCHTKMRLELSVKIGEIFKPAPFGNAQNGVLCGMKRLGSRIESILPQKYDKRLTGHLPKPPHKMVGAAPAKRGSIRYTDRLTVMS